MDSESEIPKPPPRSAPCGGSAAGYDPATCLGEEVARFKATNRFTPMHVTGFYIQAAVVLNEHRRMLVALRKILDLGQETCATHEDQCIAASRIARAALTLPPNAELRHGGENKNV